MSSSDVPEMPWGGILKRTGQAAGLAFAALVAVAAAGVRQARRDQAESERFRWTDKNRWE